MRDGNGDGDGDDDGTARTKRGDAGWGRGWTGRMSGGDGVYIPVKETGWTSEGDAPATAAGAAGQKRSIGTLQGAGRGWNSDWVQITLVGWQLIKTNEETGGGRTVWGHGEKDDSLSVESQVDFFWRGYVSLIEQEFAMQKQDRFITIVFPR